jgi:selenide,water dikinase
LAKNLEAACNGQSLKRWRPQRQALQLIGTGNNTAWMQRGRARTQAFTLLWTLKQRIDRAFMAGFSQQSSMAAAEPMACRGCAAKLPARPLNAALFAGRTSKPSRKMPPTSAEHQHCCKAWMAFQH